MSTTTSEHYQPMTYNERRRRLRAVASRSVPGLTLRYMLDSCPICDSTLQLTVVGDTYYNLPLVSFADPTATKAAIDDYGDGAGHETDEVHLYCANDHMKRDMFAALGIDTMLDLRLPVAT